MPDMQELVKLVKDLDEQLEVCIKCGMCQSVCPLFKETALEKDVARGKLELLKGLSEEMFKSPKGVKERLERCLLCGSCAHNCPRKVQVLDIFMTARKILTGFSGLDFKSRVVLKGLLANPGRFDGILARGAKCQGLFTKPASAVPQTSCATFGPDFIKGRHFIRLSKTPFHKSEAAETFKTAPAEKKGVRVAFFTGCLVDKVFPGIAEAVIKIFNHHKVDFYIPKNQGCCGIPAISSGDFETFEKLVLHNSIIFNPDDFDVLVTACATCTYTLNKVWPRMFKGDSPETSAHIKKTAEKTMDINRFLTEHLGVQAKAAPPETEDTLSVTYHDPCHLKKSLGVSKEPRSVIQAAGHVRLTEMRDADVCCGMGGSFNLKHYDLSSSIGSLKAENIAQTGCSTLSTGCPACMLQISDMLSKAGHEIHVKHPVEIYADSLEP